MVDVALFAIAQVVQPTEQTRAVGLIPVDRRPTDDEIAMLDASLPRQPQHVAVVLAGMREPRGPWGPADGSKPPTRSKRFGSLPAPAASRSACGPHSICRGIPAGAPRCWSARPSSDTAGNCIRR
ncbi:phenylalanyl-tRNA synthetase beta chain domain protein [Mycobacterium xenopi 3993]|nr:phenylalanyl-tRNA synthetase beta chain domain protein [Mycobacterium xenopi 3993]